VETQTRDGVILAQGGREHGYALHLKNGHAVFTVRIAGKATAIVAPEAAAGKFTLSASLREGGAMALSINGQSVATGTAPGLITKQPQDPLSVGEDTLTAVGDYTAPNPLKGTVQNVRINQP
jgi:arylsulfatase